MRVIFMGTPDFAVPTLRALLAAEHDVLAVYSQPPRPAGRGKKLQPSPVQMCAEAEGIEVRTPVSLKTPDAQAEFAALKADIAVVAAYGLILPQTILDAPKRGCLNVHGSLLPRWRGAAPVQRAILAGDALTGVTIMQMAAGLDTGPMLAKAETRVGSKTAGVLTSEIAAMGAQLMLEVLANLSAFEPEPQDGAAATYARKIDKSEARLDFSQPAEQVLRQVRAFNPVPGAFFEFGSERYRVLAGEVVETSISGAGDVIDDSLTILCGENAIRPTLIQRAGRPAMPRADFLRGQSIPAGTRIA